MLEMVKYLLIRSKAALAPPLRQLTTAAAGLYANFLFLIKNIRSRNAHSEPLGAA